MRELPTLHICGHTHVQMCACVCTFMSGSHVSVVYLHVEL